MQILLVPVGSVESSVLQWLSVALQDSLQAPVAIRSETIDPAWAFHPTRLQYNSTEILSRLARIPCPEQTRILGIASVDLFIPILTFVFGEAQLGKKAAVISICRLRQSFYGLPEDQRLLFERCEKEALHELGHVMNLVHCAQFDCIMHFSNSIERIDLKSDQFCDRCKGAPALAAIR